jgi:tetratricopeptide (TPR) repeat protein
LVILAVSCLTLPGCTHQIRWQQLCAEGEGYLQSGDYSKADALLSRGWDLAQTEAAQDCQVGSCLAALARVRRLTGDLEGAETLCLAALARVEPRAGKDSPCLVPPLRELVRVYRGQHADEKVQEVAGRLLELTEKVSGPDSAAIVDCLNDLIAARCAQGSCAAAEPLIERQLRLRELHLGPDHPDVAVSLCLLAENCEKLGKYDQAEIYYERALAIRVKRQPELVKATRQNLLRLSQKMMDQTLDLR